MKLPYLVLIVSMLLTIGATFIFYRNEQAKDLARFEDETDRLKSRIDGKIRGYTGMLKAARGFIESRDTVDKDSFAAFVKSLEIEKNYPEIKHIGFSKKPEQSAVNASQQAARKSLRTENSQIYFDQQHTEDQTFVSIEPGVENRLSLVENRIPIKDLINEKLFQDVIAQARDTGEPAATGRFNFNQNKDENSAGFMIFMPIYKNGEVPPTVEERRNLLKGFIYDSINTTDFLFDTQKVAAVKDIAVTIYEETAKPENLIVQASGNAPVAIKNLSSSSEIKAANKLWLVNFQTLPTFDKQSGISWTPIILVIGIIFSLLLFGMTYLESFARSKAEKISGELQESEKEKGFLLEREQKARHAAEESSRAKDEFISIVSHELRTPLNSIAGWSRILHINNLSEETKAKALQTIDKNVRMQTKIVEDLLDMSQIFSNNQELNKKDFNISELFEEVYEETKVAAQEKRVGLVKANNLNNQTINGDSDKLKKVLINLFSNALKFTPEGGEIFASILQKDKHVEIKIKDTGQGIKAEYLPKVFEHFNQADSSTTRSYGGLGLGLAITRRIIELHTGKIFVESGGEGKGAQFTIELPQNQG